MTGLYPRTLGCLHNPDTSAFMTGVKPLASLLGEAGYATAAFGKRHLHGGNMRCDDGWDEHASHLMNESPDDNYVKWVEARGHLETFSRDWAAEFGRGTGRLSKTELPRAPLGARPTELPVDLTMEAFTAQRTVDFIERCSDTENPFFCWASFYRPHQPYNAHPDFLAMYDCSHWGKGTRAGDGLARPGNLDQPAEDLPPEMRSWRRNRNLPWNLGTAAEDQQLYRDYIGAYYALVTEIDHHVGTILQALERTGQAENTIVIYTADHGDFVGAHGMVEKCCTGHKVYEDTLRVPLIVHCPERFRRGLVSDQLVSLVDLFPTLLEAAGVPAERCAHQPQGISLLPYLRGGPGPDRDFVVSENWSQTTVVGRAHKLGRWNETHGAGMDYREFGHMLFVRDEDPLEVDNRFGDPKLAAVQRRAGPGYR
jgi:arylsulfatase A-like enzyme